MKTRISVWIFSLFYIIFLADVCLAVENKNEKFASIFLSSVIGRFAPVVEGVTVTHDFVIQNNGNAPLQIKKIKTSCGCTTASYSKSIPPGGAGKVTVKFNTRGYGGRSAHKYITLYTNDNNRPEINLTISGKVERFAVIEPPGVMLAGFAGRVPVVLISGCHIGDCHYINANHWTEKRVKKMHKKMEKFSINPEWLQLEWISAAEGTLFPETMKRMETIRRSVTQEELSEASNIFSNKKYIIA